MTLDLPIVDAHHHLARLSLGYPWLDPDARTDRYHGDDRALRRDYLVEDYLVDVGRLPVAASVHVENGAADPLSEARWIDEVIRGHGPIPAVHVARADLAAADAPALLDELSALDRVRGVRHILNWHGDSRFSHTPRPHIIAEVPWRRNFARLEGLGLSFDLQVFAHQLAEAAELAGEYPGTTIVLDHAGMPIRRDAEYLALWRRGMEAVARHPNVTVKISALGTTDHRWTRDSLARVIHPAIDVFGPDRVMFASNFPVDRMYSTMAALYDAFDDLTAGYRRVERLSMFGGTAARVYCLENVDGLGG
jgi:predicted TIM-barrel fold metal-dependent hydrolase